MNRRKTPPAKDDSQPMSTLGDACVFRGGWTSAASDSGDLLMVRTSDIHRGRVDWSTVPFCRENPRDPEPFLLRRGDVLVARTGVGSAGNVAYIGESTRAVFASYVLRLRPTKQFDGRFIAFYLQSPVGKAGLAERAQGVSLINLSAKRLSNMPVPAPSLGRQKTLAKQVDVVGELVENATDALDRVLQRVPTLKAETFSMALVEADAGEPSSWPTHTLAEITANHDRQRVPLNNKQRSQRQGKFPYYGASAVIDQVDGWTHDGSYLLVSEDGQNLASRNTPVAFVATGKFWANNHVHVLAPDKRVSAEYLALAIDSQDLSEYLSGTTQPKLAKRNLDRLTITVPPKSIQRKMVRAANRLQTQWTQLETTATDLRRRIIEGWDGYLDATFGSEPSHAPERARADARLREDVLLVDDAAIRSGVPPVSVSPMRSKVQRELDTPRPGATKSQRGSSDASISDALASASDGLTPSELFERVNWTTTASLDAVDTFYAELKDAVRDGRVREVRKSTVVRLQAT